jgi:aspartate/glutamate racemase
MNKKIFGGKTSYGQLVGILMLDSRIPRIPGDPGHAETFPFPVRYGVIKDYPFQDLIDIKKDNLDLVIKAAVELEDEGVNFIAADCGLFSPFQHDIAEALKVPFLSSALNLIPLVAGFLPDNQKVGVITGDSRMLKPEHLKAAGADLNRLVIRGMENSGEFQKVVINRGQELDVERLRKGVLEAAEGFLEKHIGAVILECTNLVTFRTDVQHLLKAPVFDMVSLIEFFADGFRLKSFTSSYIP